MANAEGASEPVIRADEDLERRSQGKADSAPIQSCSLGLSTELEFRPCLQNRTNLDAERRTSNTCEQRGCRYDNITVNSGSGGPVHIGNKFTYKVCSHDSSSSETTDAHAKRIVQEWSRSLGDHSFDSRRLQLKEILDSRVAQGTCQWLYETMEFRAWDNQAEQKEEGRRLLVLKGKPGSGKSVLMISALERCKTLPVVSYQNQLILSFFFDASHCIPLECTLEGFYRSLLSQLLESIPPESSNKVLWNVSRPDSDSWDIFKLKDIILQLMPFVGGQRVVLFLDALDECQKNEHNDSSSTSDALAFLMKLSRLDTNIQICFSTRDDTIFDEEFFDSSYVLDVAAHNRPDIERYLTLELQKSKKLLPGFQAKLRSKLLSRSSNMFLWASLVLQGINKAARSEYGEKEIMDKVDETPRELSTLYETMLNHANIDKRKEALTLVRLVQVAVKPLTSAEVQSALYFSDDRFDERFSRVSTDEFSRDIYELSGGLVEVYTPFTTFSSKVPPHSIVQFIHSSVRDFLHKERLGGLGSNPDANVSEVEAQHHLCVANACMQMLDNRAVLQLADSPDEGLVQRFAFLPYASQFWTLHSRKADEAMDGHLKPPMNLAWCSNKSKAIFKLFEKYRCKFHVNKKDLPGCANLHCRGGQCHASSDAQDCQDSMLVLLASEGCSTLFVYHAQKCLHGKRCHKNQHILERAFFFAAHNGWIKTMESVWNTSKLKAVDIDVDMLRVRGSSPLYSACYAGKADVVDFLLHKGASPFSEVELVYGLPLHAAAVQGHLEVVHLLLRSTVPEAKELLARRNNNGDTILHPVAEEGRHLILWELVAILAKHELLHLVDAKNEYGETALELANLKNEELGCYGRRNPSLAPLLECFQRTIEILEMTSMASGES